MTIAAGSILFLCASVFIFVFGLIAGRRRLFPYRLFMSLVNEVPRRQRSPEERAISLCDVTVTGLPGYDQQGALVRVPSNLGMTWRSALRDLSQLSTGGIISFRTNSAFLRVRAHIGEIESPYSNKLMVGGIDIYIDGVFLKSFAPNHERLNIFVPGLGGQPRLIEIYLPLYAKMKSLQLSVAEGSWVTAIEKESDRGVIVYYGSSITQGCWTSRPALSYPAIVSRQLGRPHVNLGFAANGLGDIQVSKYIAELDPKAVVLDFWANPSSAVYGTVLPKFIGEIRSKLPFLPIFVLGTFYSPGRELENRKKDDLASATVAKLQEAGDENIFFVSGLFVESDEDGLVDGLHLNTLGFSTVAYKLTNVLSGAGL